MSSGSDRLLGSNQDRPLLRAAGELDVSLRAHQGPRGLESPTLAGDRHQHGPNSSPPVPEALREAGLDRIYMSIISGQGEMVAEGGS